MTARLRLRHLLAALLAALLLAPAPAALAGDWTVAEIDGPPGIRWIQPTAVNNDGVVVGRAYFPGRSDMSAFRWEDGHMIELPSGGASSSIAWDVNDAGTIVGSLYGLDNGAVWTTSGSGASAVATLSMTAHNISGRWGSGAYGINQRGLIAGSAGDSGNVPVPWNPRGVDYDNRFPALSTGGGWSRIQIPPIVTETETSRSVQIIGGDAMKVNDNGDVLVGGMNASGRPRISPGGGVPGDTLEMVAGNQGFNDANQIAGRSLFSNPNRDPFSARVWSAGVFIDVGIGQERSRANAINNLGWVVGRAGTEDWQAEYRQAGNAWLWRIDGGAEPLAVLGPTGWSYANATDVNDNGVIVGVGRHGMKEVGFMMTPTGIAHELSGTVLGADGNPAAGATVRIVNAAGQEQTPAVTTGADGRYRVSLLRGDYAVTVLPEGQFAPAIAAGCRVPGAITCTLGLSRNRVVDFFSIAPPPLPPSVPPTRTPTRTPDGRGATARGPGIRGPPAGATVTATGGGLVGIGLTFSEAASGTVTLEAPATRARARARRGGRARARRAAAARAITLASASFRLRRAGSVVVRLRLNRAGRSALARDGKIRATAVVRARGASGAVTVTRFTVTVKKGRAAARARGRGRGRAKGRARRGR